MSFVFVMTEVAIVVVILEDATHTHTHKKKLHKSAMIPLHTVQITSITAVVKTELIIVVVRVMDTTMIN